MAPRSKPMPIHKLSDEILCRIFEIEADMDRDPDIGYLKDRFRANNFVRWSSQVCRHWRYVTLHKFPRLWGRVIDFELFPPGNRWMKIVLQRASLQPLFVRARITEGNSSWFNGFFERFLRRIRVLNIFVAMQPALATQEALSFLTRPADFLVKFECRMPGPEHSLPFPPYLLFNNRANSLRAFHSRNLTPNIAAPWVGQLRSLHLFDTTFQTCTVDELYDMLSRLPLLESLDISYAIFPLEKAKTTPFADTSLQSNEGVRTVSLPHLRELALVGHSMNLCLRVMNMIIPSRGCKVDIAESITPQSEVDLDASDCLTNYVAGYFSCGNTSSMLLRVTPTEFIITDSSTCRKSTENHVNFDIQFTFEDQFYAGRNFVTALLLRRVLRCPLPGIKNLELELGPGVVQASDGAFVGFIKSFSALEVLTTKPDTLWLLSLVRGELTPIFPRLKTLRMLELRLQDHQNAPVKLLGGCRMIGSDVDFLASFLMQRKGAGRPLDVFEFTLSDQSHLKDLSFLEDVTGLKVEWAFGVECGEYVCGTGVPELLNFE